MTQSPRIPWLVTFAAALLLPGIAGAQAVLTDDAFTTSTAPSKNFGYWITLNVNSTSRTYLKFDLSRVSSAGITPTEVTQATLRLWVDPFETPGALDVYEVTSPWSETAITWANAPTLNNTAAVSGVALSSSSQLHFLTVDLTALVQAWLANPQSNQGIALVAHPNTGISVLFDSKENIVTSHEPELEIVATGPAGTPGAAATVQVGKTNTVGAGGQAAVTNSGTPNAAILNFAIPQGVQGPAGAPGAGGTAATVQVGKTTTAPAGSLASVFNTGTPNAAVLSFLIPQGSTGLTGPQGSPGPVLPDLVYTDKDNTLRSNQTLQGNLALAPTGAATPSLGFNSNPLDLQASASDGTNPQQQVFRLQGEPTGNGTASSSSSLNLLFGAKGAAPTETGLSFASSGQITFAPGQTFPGTSAFTAAGDLSGTASSQIVTKLQGVPLSTAGTGTLFPGAVLGYNGTSWTAVPGFSPGGDLAGTANSQKLISLVGFPLSGSTGSLGPNPVLGLNNGVWMPVPGFSAAGDLTGSPSLQIVSKLQGTPLSLGGTGTLPAGAVLSFNGTAWAPAIDLAFTDKSNTFTSNQILQGNVALAPTGLATAAQGFSSNPLDLQASTFNGANSQQQVFRWQAEPTGNDTASSSGTLNLLFGGNGASPAETGLSIAPNGQITFAPGQSFSSGNITGDLSVGGVLSVSGETVLNNGLLVSGSANLGGAFTTVGNNLDVGGPARLSNTLTVSGATNLNGATTVNNSLAVSGGTNLSGMTTVNNLTVNGSSNLSGNATTVGGSLSIVGPASLGNTLSVVGPASLGDSLTVSGATNLNGTTTANNLTVNATTNLSGLMTTVGNFLSVGGPTSLSNTLTVSGATNLNGATAVNNSLAVGGTTFLTGPAIFNSNLLANSNSKLIGPTEMDSTLSVNGALTGSSATFQGSISAGGAILPAAGTAAGTPVSSGPLDFFASSWNGAKAVNEQFRWQAEGNASADTGSLNLLTSTSANALAETGLSIASNGLITFAPGQSFPSTINGNTTIGGTLNVSGATTLNNSLALSGALTGSVGSFSSGLTASSGTFGPVSATTGTFTGLLSGTTANFSGATNLNGPTTVNNTLAVGGERFVDSNPYLNLFSGNTSSGGLHLYRNDGLGWGYFYADNGGIGLLNGSGQWAVRSTGAPNAINSDVSFFTDNSTLRGYFNSAGLTINSGNLSFGAANPTIQSGGSYIVIPNGAYFSGGTGYFQNQAQFRGGVNNDQGSLTLTGSNGLVNAASTYFQVAGKYAIDGSDGWLRLNQQNSFPNGVYTPYNFRADGNIEGNIYYDHANPGYYVQPSSTSNLVNISGNNFVARDLGDGDAFIGTRDANGNGLLPGYSLGKLPVLGSHNVNLYLSVGGTFTGYFTTDGYHQVSDERMKTDIRDLGAGDFRDALASLDKIRSVRFRYKQEVEAAKNRPEVLPEAPLHIGVIAQSLPESVKSEDRQTGIFGMSQGDMLGFLVASVRGVRGETQELVATQQAQIAAQQAKIKELEERLAALEAARGKR